VRTVELEGPYAHEVALLCSWLDGYLGRFIPVGSTLDDPAVKPAVELLFVLRGLRGHARAAADATGLDDWIDDVVGRLWDPVEAWLRGLCWSRLGGLARAGRRELANLIVVPLLEDLAGRSSIAHERARLVLSEIPRRALDEPEFDLAFASELTAVRSSRWLADRQLRQLIDDPGALEAQPSAYYDVTHAVFLATSMGQRREWCPTELRPRLDRCLVTGLASGADVADLDLSCEIVVAARWSLPDPSAPLRAGTEAALRAVAETVSTHGYVPYFQGRSHSPFSLFDRCYHQTLVALLALVCAAEPADIRRRERATVPAGLGSIRG
jgi:hypothetical protein